MSYKCVSVYVKNGLILLIVPFLHTIRFSEFGKFV